MENYKKQILEETDDYLAILKKAGQLSQGDNKSESLFDTVNENYKGQLHLLNRLDRPVSGVMIISKKQSFCRHFNLLQRDNKIHKRYLALVEGDFSETKGVLQNNILHDRKSNKAKITKFPLAGSKQVVLEFELVKKLERYTLLRLNLSVGKFHQIRAQLAHIGYPIKGDVKYGARRANKDRSIYLHSYSIEFKDRKENLTKIIAPLNNEDNLWRIVKENIEK